MINGEIRLSPTEKLKFLIGDGIKSIGKFVNMWYQVNKDGVVVQYAYMEHEDFENAWNYILEAIERYEHGFIQCCNCGKWIKFEKAKHTCPAGCYCVECYAEGLKAEQDYFSYPDSFSSGPGPR